MQIFSRRHQRPELLLILNDVSNVIEKLLLRRRIQLLPSIPTSILLIINLLIAHATTYSCLNTLQRNVLHVNQNYIRGHTHRSCLVRNQTYCGSVRRTRSYCGFLNEEQFKWHLIVAHLLFLHHIESSSGAIPLFRFNLQSDGLNFPFQVLLMWFTSFVFIPPTYSLQSTLTPWQNNATDAAVIQSCSLVHSGAVVLFFW